MDDEVKKMSLFNRPGGYMYGLEWDGETTVSFVRLVTPYSSYPAQNVMTCHDLHYDTHVIKDIIADQARQIVYIKTGDGLVDKYSFDEIESFFSGEDPDVEVIQVYPEEPKNDIVNHPSHYQSNQGIEVIQVIGAFTEDLVGMEAVCTANVLKYVCRWKKKNGIEDLKKAEWYLKKLIDIKEAESK